MKPEMPTWARVATVLMVAHYALGFYLLVSFVSWGAACEPKVGDKVFVPDYIPAAHSLATFWWACNFAQLAAYVACAAWWFIRSPKAEAGG